MQWEYTDPCSESNPGLWELFCRITGRPWTPSPNWTQTDVLNCMEDKVKTQNKPERLEELLCKLQYTNKCLAILVYTTERTVYRWLSGQSRIPAAVILLLEAMIKDREKDFGPA